MKAAVLIGFGGVDQLVIRELPEPKAGQGEVKVRVVATSINPVDWKLRQGQKRPGVTFTVPAVLGRDASGEVVEVGPGVTRLRVGARVAGLVWGGYAESIVAKEEAWAEVPESMDLVDAAAFPLVTLTGSELIEEGARPRAGDTILITGAVGSVGRAAVYTARAQGASVWAGVRSSQKAAAASLGVEGVVALDADHFAEQLPELDALADTVGGVTTQVLLDRVKRGGSIGSVVDDPPGARERGLEVRHVGAHPKPDRLATLLGAIADGSLVIPIAKRFSLSQIREAQAAAEQGLGGKVVVQM
jgi:NADPH:quinone reductase-like Zn-dependent oxidoreductase